MYSRRIFLQRTGLAAGALALPELLRLPSGIGPLLDPLGLRATASSGPDLPIVRGVDLQPLLAQVRRLITATDYLGSPLPASDRQSLEAAGSSGARRRLWRRSSECSIRTASPA